MSEPAGKKNKKNKITLDKNGGTEQKLSGEAKQGREARNDAQGEETQPIFSLIIISDNHI